MKFDKILNVVSEETGVAAAAILGHDRTDRVVVARLLLMWVMRKRTTMGIREIADCLGRSHAAVICGVRSANQQIEDDAVLAKTLARILKRLEEGEDPLEKLLGKLQSCAKELRTIANRFDELVEALSALGNGLPSESAAKDSADGERS